MQTSTSKLASSCKLASFKTTAGDVNFQLKMEHDLEEECLIHLQIYGVKNIIAFKCVFKQGLLIILTTLSVC